jgi:hypothetical protein
MMTLPGASWPAIQIPICPEPLMPRAADPSHEQNEPSRHGLMPRPVSSAGLDTPHGTPIRALTRSPSSDTRQPGTGSSSPAARRLVLPAVPGRYPAGQKAYSLISVVFLLPHRKIRVGQGRGGLAGRKRVRETIRLMVAPALYELCTPGFSRNAVDKRRTECALPRWRYCRRRSAGVRLKPGPCLRADVGGHRKPGDQQAEQRSGRLGSPWHFHESQGRWEW